jgi:hypothetical protein
MRSNKPLSLEALRTFVESLMFFIRRPISSYQIVWKNKQFRKEWANRLWNQFFAISPLGNRLRWKIKRGLWHLGFLRDLIQLCHDRIRYGQCFVVESGFCCDTGNFSHEHRYTNPWQAFRNLYYSNTEDWSDGPSSARVGDGWMWENDDHYSQAPDGWDALQADREAEDQEIYEQQIYGKIIS